MPLFSFFHRNNISTNIQLIAVMDGCSYNISFDFSPSDECWRSRFPSKSEDHDCLAVLQKWYWLFALPLLKLHLILYSRIVSSISVSWEIWQAYVLICWKAGFSNIYFLMLIPGALERSVRILAKVPLYCNLPKGKFLCNKAIIPWHVSQSMRIISFTSMVLSKITIDI